MSATDDLVYSDNYKVTFRNREIENVDNFEPAEETVDMEMTETGEQGPGRSSTGVVRYGDVTVTIVLTEETATYLYNQFKKAQRERNTSKVKGELILEYLGPNGKTVMREHYVGCWIKKYQPPKFKAKAADDLKETYTFSVFKKKKKT